MAAQLSPIADVKILKSCGMFFTLASHIAEVENDLPPALVSKDALEQLKKLSTFFPYDISRDIGFESHLAQKGGNVDFLFSVRKQSLGSKLLSENYPEFFSSFTQTGVDRWKRINHFSQDWITPGSFFNQNIDTIWFEFDHDRVFNPEALKMFLGIVTRSTRDPEQKSDFASALLQNFSGVFSYHPLDDKIIQNADSCITRLPDKAKLYHLGFKLGEDIHSLRLVLVNISFRLLNKYLKEIDWPGDYEKLRILLDSVSDRFDYFVFNLDMGDRVFPKLGIECYLFGFMQPDVDSRWSSNLNWLVENGWCLPEKKEGLLGYSGNHDVEHFYRLNYRNSLNHLKIVFNENMVETVKAYFGTYIRSYTTAGYK